MSDKNFNPQLTLYKSSKSKRYNSQPALYYLRAIIKFFKKIMLVQVIFEEILS